MAYNSAYTGQEIDAAIGSVKSKESTWDEKQNKITGQQGQIVGFDDQGNAIAQDDSGRLPTGGTPGQMLYQGETGPEWGIPPYLGSTPQLDYSQMKSLHALGITDLNDVVEPGTYVGMSGMGGYPEIANMPEDFPMPFFYMDVYVFNYPGDDFYQYIVQQVIRPISEPDYGFDRYGDSASPEEALSFYNWSFSKLAKSTKISSISGLSAENVQDAIEEINAKATPKAVSVTLAAAGWSNNTQTVTVNGVDADETKQEIHPMPATATAGNQDAYVAAGIMCTGQAANSLTFTCSTVPTQDIDMYITITEVTAG